MFLFSHPVSRMRPLQRLSLRAWLAAGGAALALLAGCATAPDFDESGMDRLDHVADPAVAAAIAQRIAAGPAAATSPEGLSLIELSYRGQRVWLHLAGCCDRLHHAYDDQGRRVCSPAGGLDGRGDGRCPDMRLPAGWRVGQAGEVSALQMPQPPAPAASGARGP